MPSGISSGQSGCLVEAVIDCKDSHLNTGGQVELSEDVLDVNFDCGLGDVQLASYFFVAGASSDLSQNIALTRR